MFTYQGQLKLNGHPLDGDADFAFLLWDAVQGGNRIALPLRYPQLPVVKELLNVNLDFGPVAFDGDTRWLQIEVRSSAGSGSYVPLTPRQQVTPVPYAMALGGLRTIPNATSPTSSRAGGETGS